MKGANAEASADVNAYDRYYSPRRELIVTQNKARQSFTQPYTRRLEVA